MSEESPYVTLDHCHTQHQMSFGLWLVLWAALGSAWVGIGASFMLSYRNSAQVDALRDVVDEREKATIMQFESVSNRLDRIDFKLDDIRDKLTKGAP